MEFDKNRDHVLLNDAKHRSLFYKIQEWKRAEISVSETK